MRRVIVVYFDQFTKRRRFINAYHIQSHHVSAFCAPYSGVYVHRTTMKGKNGNSELCRAFMLYVTSMPVLSVPNSIDRFYKPSFDSLLINTKAPETSFVAQLNLFHLFQACRIINCCYDFVSSRLVQEM